MFPYGIDSSSKHGSQLLAVAVVEWWADVQAGSFRLYLSGGDPPWSFGTLCLAQVVL